MSLLISAPIPCLSLSGTGTPPFQLTTSFVGGLTVSLGGVRFVTVLIRSAKSAGTGNTFRLVNASINPLTGTPMNVEIQGVSQRNPSTSSAEFSYTAATDDDIILYDLGGVCNLVQIQAKANGGAPNSGDTASSILTFVSGS